jgi:hypothetical protein
VDPSLILANRQRNIIDFVCQSLSLNSIRDNIESEDFLGQSPEEIISDKKIYGKLKTDVENGKKGDRKGRSKELEKISNFWYGFIRFVLSGECDQKYSGGEEDLMKDDLEEVFEERYSVLVTGLSWL